MNAYEKLSQIQKEKSSILCVGLDTDINKLPDSLKGKPEAILEFNRQIIEATKDLACAYKMNFAFYEQYGLEGIEALKKTFELMPENVITIADAKRGDIGNTSTAYAKAIFDYFKADAVTVNPYMGHDSVKPFLEFNDKLVFLLTLTSNSGASNFQRLLSHNKPVYQHVIEQSNLWAEPKNIGYVVGATSPNELNIIRELAPFNVFLIPGLGAQGGSVEATVTANAGGPAIFNVSRAIIYASKNNDFAEAARKKAYNYKLSFL